MALITRRSDGRSSVGQHFACPRHQIVGAWLASQPGGATFLDRETSCRDRQRVGRLQPSSQLVDGRERPQACGAGVVPRTHSPSSFFQIGAFALISSMISRAPANAASRCGADTAIATEGSDRGTVPTRCSAAAAHRPCRCTRPANDLGHLALGHLRVSLVFELRHLPSHAGERDYGAGSGIAHQLDERIEGQRLAGQPSVNRPDRAARDRRDQRHLVAAVQRSRRVRVLLVDGHHDGDAVGQGPHLLERVADDRAIGQLELHLGRSRPLSETGEKPDANLHGLKG